MLIIQKWILVSRISFLLAILLIFNQIVWEGVLDNQIFGIITIILFIFSLTIYLIMGGPKCIGVPNNSYKEFRNISNLKLKENDNIEIEEVNKNCWIIKNANIKFNMKGWILQKNYIYDIICLSLIIREYNNKGKPIISLLSRHSCLYKNIRIKYLLYNGKVIIRKLVINRKIRRTLSLFFRVISCFEATGQGLMIRNLFKHKNVSIKNYYNFYM